MTWTAQWLQSLVLKGKRIKARFTYIAACAASAALCVTDRAGVQPWQQPKPVFKDSGLQP